MRLSFNDTLARTLRGIHRKEQHGDHAASYAAAFPDTFKENGHKYNHFEPNVNSAFLTPSLLTPPHIL